MRKVYRLFRHSWTMWQLVTGVIAALGVLFLVGDGIWLALNWPDWDELAQGEIPKSKVIRTYEARTAGTATGPVKWRPVPFEKISPKLREAVVLAEDVRFYKHYGIDLAAIGDAIQHNLREGELDVGGSTISQQTVKNLFLSMERTFLRKWHEAILTLAMERRLEKDRILEIYLNIAQFGPRIFGAAAAAEEYYDTSVSELTEQQAAGLAAVLPSPEWHNPRTATHLWQRRRDKVLRWLHGYFGPATDGEEKEQAKADPSSATTSVTAPAPLTAASLTTGSAPGTSVTMASGPATTAGPVTAATAAVPATGPVAATDASDVAAGPVLESIAESDGQGQTAQGAARGEQGVTR